MKQKEIIQLAVAVVILFVAGLLIFTQLGPKKSGASQADKYTVEKVRMIEADYNEEALRRISDSSKVRDFYTAPDLKSGIGNPQPFNIIR